MNSKSKWMLSGVSSILALSLLMPTAHANTSKLDELEQEQQQVQKEQQKLEKERKELEEKEEDLSSGIEKKEGEIEKTSSKLDRIVSEIQQLDKKMQETQSKIDTVQAEIDQTKEEIDELKEAIKELERKIDERTELLKERARAIQLSGGSVDYIDVLLGANSFIDFIDRFSAVNTLIEADREIMREQAADKKELAAKKEAVETILANQEDRRAELVSLKASLDSQKKEQAGLKAQMEAEQKRLASEKNNLEAQHEEALEVSAAVEKQIMGQQARMAKLAQQEEAERTRIAEAERKAAAEKAAAEKAAAERAAAEKAAAERAAAEKAAAEKAAAEKAATKSSSASASTASPAPAPAPAPTPTPAPAPAPVVKPSANFVMPASGRHTSGFGGRDIGDGAETHLGYDIANSPGTPVVASAAGYVSFAGSMGGYGNVIIINHSINGQPYATAYAHLSSIGVSVGQKVGQRQFIGGMGNTGRSTGPHLHFEIHVGSWNGSRSNAVNPANYLSY